MIGFSFVYVDANQYTTTKTIVSGIVKEKYISYSKISSFYKTTIEISDKDSKYIVTIDDSLAFDNNVIGSKIYVEKKDTINKKTNSILETNYKYISNTK